MGCDGGVIATKRKFMRHGNTKSHDPKADASMVLEKRVTTCALTDEPLKEPIVACEMGNFYNKDSLLMRLLDKTLPEEFKHIRSLRDVITCKFTLNLIETEKSTSFSFLCPITKVECRGRHPFVIMRECGCVLSEKAMREVRVTECLVCGKSFVAQYDVIQLIPSIEQLPLVKERMTQRKSWLKKQKKDRKNESKANVVQELELNDQSAQSKSNDISTNGKRKMKEKASLVSSKKTIQTSHSGKAIQEAMNIIQLEKSKSSVYSSLFKRSEQKNPNDLMMTVAGMRGTLA